MPTQRDGHTIPAVANSAALAHLCKYIIELHELLLNHDIGGRQAIAAQLAGRDGKGIAIQYWAEQLIPQIGALERGTVAANFLDRLVRGAVDLGASRPKILAAIHVSDAALRNPIGRLASPVLANLFAAIETELKDPAAAMKMAGYARPHSFSDFGVIALFSANVGQMLADTIHIQAFRHNLWDVELHTDCNPASLTWTFPDDAGNHLDACSEFTVASYVHLYRSSVSTNLAPLAVRFRHRPRFDQGLYAAMLGCPVFFGAAQTSIELDPGQLNVPSPRHNPELQSRLLAVYNQPMQWLAKGQRYAAFTYLYLASELNKSSLKLDRVAASFGLTERTLRRRLVDEGFPFRDLLDKVRRDICDIYRLEDRRTISTIAELLGYAELSAFTRAHKRWYGRPPSMRGPPIKNQPGTAGENGGRSKD
jgi:AraC-like DNA-binding protein